MRTRFKTFNATRLITIPAVLAIGAGPALLGAHVSWWTSALGLLLWSGGLAAFIMGIRNVEVLRDEDLIREDKRIAWRAGWLHRGVHPSPGDPEYAKNPYNRAPGAVEIPGTKRRAE